MNEPSTDFDWDAIAPDEPDAPGQSEPESADSVTEHREAALQNLDHLGAVARILEILTAGATPRRAGQRAFILAHGMRLSGCKTQKDLAAKMGISTGRVSQILNLLESDPALSSLIEMCRESARERKN